MEKRLFLEQRGRPASEITELTLDNSRSTGIVGLTDEFTALETLSLINVGLTTLKGFPKLASLKKLELSDNRISNGLNHLVSSPKLTHLNLSGNKIKDFESLEPLAEFANLEVLDLFYNDVTNLEGYRDKVFEMISSLKYLDGFDSKEQEAPSDVECDEELNGNDSDGNDTDDISDEDDFEEEEFEQDDDDEDDNGISLAEVYNENIEEDGSDWGEDGNEAAEEEEDIEDSEEDEDGADKADAPAPPAAEEEPPAPAQGKKRKHDG